MQPAQPYRLQQANRSEGQCNPIRGTVVPQFGIRLPATSMRGSIRVMNQLTEIDQSGLLQLQEIWVVQTMTQTGIGLRGL